MRSSFAEGWQKQEKVVVRGRMQPGEKEKKKKQNNFITELQFTQSVYSTQKVGLTWFNTGDGEGFGTEVGPVIGCGGLFISRSFIRLH